MRQYAIQVKNGSSVAQVNTHIAIFGMDVVDTRQYNRAVTAGPTDAKGYFQAMLEPATTYQFITNNAALPKGTFTTPSIGSDPIIVLDPTHASLITRTGTGTAWPANVADGMLFYRSDLKVLAVWDASISHWVSARDGSNVG